MTNKDKMIAAFLVSIGMFSAAAATKYVGALSDDQKNAIVPAVTLEKNVIIVADSVIDDDNKKNIG